MRKSKYLNQMFDNGWVCTHVTIRSVTGAYYKGTRKRTKTPGHRNYEYHFTRLTSDGKFEKTIKLTGQQANKVLKGERTVEYYADCKELVAPTTPTKERVSYYFNLNLEK